MLSDARRAAYYRIFAADSAIQRLVTPGERVIDVGCSDGRGSDALHRLGSMGADVYRPALASAYLSGRRGPVAQADARRLPFHNQGVDVAVCLDVVEHFDKTDALIVLAELERIARRLIIVFTPNGFVPQPPGEDEPWQEHRCGFDAKELEGLGYRVTGRGGVRHLRGSYGRFRFGVVGQVAAVGSGLVTRSHPGLAFHLLAVKELNHAAG